MSDNLASSESAKLTQPYGVHPSIAVGFARTGPWSSNRRDSVRLWLNEQIVDGRGDDWRSAATLLVRPDASSKEGRGDLLLKPMSTMRVPLAAEPEQGQSSMVAAWLAR
jgi:hypothetical protein